MSSFFCHDLHHLHPQTVTQSCDLTVSASSKHKLLRVKTTCQGNIHTPERSIDRAEALGAWMGLNCNARDKLRCTKHHFQLLRYRGNELFTVNVPFSSTRSVQY